MYADEFDYNRIWRIEQTDTPYPHEIHVNDRDSYREDAIGCNHRCLFCGYTWQRKFVSPRKEYAMGYGLFNIEDKERAMLDLDKDPTCIDWKHLRTTAIDGSSERIRCGVNKRIIRRWKSKRGTDMQDNDFDLPSLHLPETIDIDTDLDFTVDDFDLLDDAEDKRILRPKMARSAVYTSIDYTYAKQMAEGCALEPGSRTTVIVPGNFIFGDLLEALIIDRGIDADELTISTLSISQENVDSLKNIMLIRPDMRLNLIVSAYFYSHNKYGLVPYIYEELDIDNRFQCAFTNTHMKIALIHSRKGNHYTLTGSANLRSASCLEQFDLEEGQERYQFFYSALSALIEKYKTIDFDKPKIGRGAATWQAVREK